MTKVEYEPGSLCFQATLLVNEPFEVAEIHILQVKCGDEYFDVYAFLLDGSETMRLAVWIYMDDAYIARPETVWQFVHRFACHHDGWRVCARRASRSGERTANEA